MSRPNSSPGQTREQRALNAARGVQIALHAALVARHLLVEARVFDRNREMRGQNRKHLHVVRREIVELRAFEIHHADHALLVNHGHGQLRARLGIQHAVARIERHVRNHHRAAKLCRRADDAFVCRNGGFFLHALAEFHGDAVAKDAGLSS